MKFIRIKHELMDAEYETVIVEAGQPGTVIEQNEDDVTVEFHRGSTVVTIPIDWVQSR